jgi:thioredoxin 1
VSLADKLRGPQGPVVVQFHAPWCGPCKTLAPVVDRMEQEFAGRATVVRIDVDAEPELAKEAGVRGVPTLVAYRDGTEVRRHTGGLDTNGLRTFFQSALGEVPATKPVGKPAWHLAAKLGAAMALLLLASRLPGLEWTRWVGFAALFWAMRDLCPSCQTGARSR